MTASDKQVQDTVDAANAAFWDELCGSQLARQLGIKDHSFESLRKFDDGFFGFYPYLYKYLPFPDLKDKRVLEVGLGYGSVTQKIIDAGARFSGLDIAAGPVAMAEHRCNMAGVADAVTRQGNILAPPFEAGTFDWIIAIGCLHHTGNLPAAINAVHGLLRDGGEACIMVYNAASYRQFVQEPLSTAIRKFAGPFVAYKPRSENEAARGRYDASTDGTAAPQTEFVTKSELGRLCGAFSDVRIQAENIGAEGPFRRFPRERLCKYLGPFIGLDLYCRLVK